MAEREASGMGQAGSRRSCRRAPGRRPGAARAPGRARSSPTPTSRASTSRPAALDALAGSIGATGLLQPLIVRPLDGGRYELVAGERRWRAAQQAGLDRVPAVIRISPEDERLQAALIENMVREDLNPVDEARACAALVDDLGISKEELGRRVGRSRAAISNLIRLLDLPDPVLGAARARASSARATAARSSRSTRPGRRESSPSRPPPRAGRCARPRTTRARPATARKARARAAGISAEERAALRDAEDALGEALGADVRVRKAGDGVKAEITLDDLAELASLARR